MNSVCLVKQAGQVIFARHWLSSLQNPSVLAGCQVCHYYGKATVHTPGLQSCFAGTSHGRGFRSGAFNAAQSAFTSLLSPRLDQDMNTSYSVQPDTGGIVPQGSHMSLWGADPSAPHGGASCKAKNEGHFFLAKHRVLAQPDSDKKPLVLS